MATPDGLVPIETISVDDLVLAYDEATGKVEAKPVTDLIRPEPKETFLLAMTDAQGERETFEATADHPWLVLTSDGVKHWVETAALAPGDRLLAGDGETLTLDAKTLQPTLVATYNLTVADHHTFLVGEDGAVVHNVCRWFNPRFLPPQLRQAINNALERLNAGVRGSRYDNTTGALPRDVSYRRVRVDTPENNVRIVQGSDGSRYITFDHYETFSRIR